MKTREELIEKAWGYIADNYNVGDKPMLSEIMTDFALSLDGENVQEFVDEIGKWANVTFPKSTTYSKLKHLEKELVNELIPEVLKEDHTIDFSQLRRIKQEFADVFILLLNAMDSQRITFADLMSEAKKKMEVNKNRKWGKPGEHGVVEHIRESDSDPITVKALRKRGTDMWYYWEPNGSYWEDTNVDIGASIRTIGFMNYKASVRLPEDAEPITIECKIIEP